MSKTKLQAKMINKFVVFWQTHVLIFAVIDHKTTNIPEINISSVHGFVRLSQQNSLKMLTKRPQKPAFS